MATVRRPKRPVSMVDLLDTRHRTDPYPLLHELRERSPFASVDGSTVVLGRYEDCARVLRDPRMSSRQAYTASDERVSLEPSFLVLDPPDHTRLRRLVAKAFTPRAVAGLEPRITELVDQALSSASEHGEIDVIAALAHPLPVTVVCEWLGVPPEDGLALRNWTGEASMSMDPYAMADPAVRERIAAAECALEDYFRRLVAKRRAAPREDLLSRLIAVEEEGERLTTGELLATAVLLLLAGHETTTNLIGNGLLALLRHPAELNRLRADPLLAEASVEEALRYDAPVQLTSRETTESVRFGEIDAPPGTRVTVLLAAANRDPAVYAEPDRFRIGRPSRPHLAFSGGPHFCLGAGLGRMEGAVAFQRFAARVVNPRLPENAVTYRPHINLRGPARLTVRFDAIRPADA
jgi:cytochrome P450